MRFIGNKENLIEKIYQVMIKNNIQGEIFFDFFAGTTSVGKFFKKKNYTVFSSDLLYFSYVLQKAYIENNQDPEFHKLLNKIDVQDNTLFSSPLEKVIEFLNKIPPKEGFIYRNYTPKGTENLKQRRMFYTEENGKIIDAIRIQIEEWKNKDLITENEYFILIACLIETVPYYANITGVYAAFQKKWDARALKKLTLRTIEIIKNTKNNRSYNKNSVDLIDLIETDILYLDPPYNQRQYAPNYHLLDTIAKYDEPEIKGVAGLRNYTDQKSKFCNPKTALEELETIARKAKYKTIILSYNTEGIMKQEDIISLLQKFGKVKLEEIEYLRYKSNNNGEAKTKKFIKEQLYILKKYEK